MCKYTHTFVNVQVSHYRQYPKGTEYVYSVRRRRIRRRVLPRRTRTPGVHPSGVQQTRAVAEKGLHRAQALCRRHQRTPCPSGHL